MPLCFIFLRKYIFLSNIIDFTYKFFFLFSFALSSSLISEALSVHCFASINDNNSLGYSYAHLSIKISLYMFFFSGTL